jgi:hypothetical protein
MTAPHAGAAVHCRTEDYEWRPFPCDEARSYREAHAYNVVQVSTTGVILLTPWCEEGSPHPLRHDRPSVGGPISDPRVRVPCCVRCRHRWNAAVLEAQQAEVAR